MVAPGQKAPDFAATALIDGQGELLELFAEVRDHEAVVLLFAPADFVPTCTADFVAVREAGWQDHPDLAVIGLTGDSLFSHATYADQYDLPFPLISDFHASVAGQYDLVLDEWEGHRTIPGRAAVVVDGDWDVRALEDADPLDRSAPAPVERVVGTLETLGLDVGNPDVTDDL
jgi:peroxiredoxin